MNENSSYPTQQFAQFTTRYEHVFSTNNLNLTILYIHGLGSNPWGKKPEAVKSLCEKLHLNFYRFELLGHGIDANNYEQADINLWKQQILQIIDTQIKGKFIIVGHCIGGWLGLLSAQERPTNLQGLICTSTSPNLAEMIQSRATPELKASLETQGKLIIKIEKMIFTFTKQFIQSGLKNAILEQPEIPISCPVHLIQGLQDTFIDWQIVYKIAQKLHSPQTIIKLLKNGNHHLQHPSDLIEINNSLQSIVNFAQHNSI